MDIRRLTGLAFVAATAVAAYLRVIRPRVLDWGARDDERTRVLPGDEILPDATLQTTRAVTINAPPERIWPWLTQMGPRPRAGVYTYDWLQRRLGIDIQNADSLLAGIEPLQPGDFLALNDKGMGLAVRASDPLRALVLQWQPAESTWAFVLVAQGDGTTRLLSRNRLRGTGWGFRLGMLVLMEPGSLVMERKMLLGIKQRAENMTVTGDTA